jgi:signal peptidase I
MRRVLLGVLLASVTLRVCVLEPYVARGTSMWPTCGDGDYLIVDALSPRFLTLERGELVVLRDPLLPRARLVKRVIGLPGETVTIENGLVFIESPSWKGRIEVDEPYVRRRGDASFATTLGVGEIFVLGDNRPDSIDSRAFGPTPLESVEGRVILRLGSLSRFLRR